MRILKFIIFLSSISVLSPLILAQELPKVKISIGNNGIVEQYGKTLITAELSAPSSKDVYIDFDIKGTATYNKDYLINFSTKNTVKIAAGGNGLGRNSNQTPSGGRIFVDEDKTIYISDTRNQRVQKWIYGATTGVTIAGGNVYGGTTLGSRPDQFSGIDGIYVDSEKNVFVCDRNNNRIQKWTPGATSGITVAGGNGNGFGANQIRPSDLKIDSDGNLIILDRILGNYNFRIQKWNKNANSATTLVDFTNNSKFYVTGFYLDDSGDIYLTGDLAPGINYAVIRCPKNNPQNWELVAGGNGFGNALNQLNMAVGVRLFQNNLFISDSRGHSILKWPLGAKSGEVVMGTRGVSGNTIGYLSLPNGIFIDRFGNLYVGDEGSNSIQIKQMQPQIMIPAGKTSASMELLSIDDTDIEGADEMIEFKVSSVLNCQVDNNINYQITLQENDFPDTDKDQISDHLDNCPLIYNPDQKDSDKDGIGDVCDDSDEDGITDDKDLCQGTEKGKSVDKNGCTDNQKDTDGDGITDDKDDCPFTRNPSIPLINKINDLELASSAGYSYQWYLDGKLISGANQAFFRINSTGSYSVQLKDEKGCISPMSASIIILITAINEENNKILIFPNPTEGIVNLRTTEKNNIIELIQLSDMRGTILKQIKETNSSQQLDLVNYPTGVYLLEVIINGNKSQFKIQKR
jgi:sugar lactone lactonase YvrE